ncbi:CsgE family curli-type amyloid fiber assembly protein [Aliiglaciecola aliphaticivorans]
MKLINKKQFTPLSELSFRLSRWLLIIGLTLLKPTFALADELALSGLLLDNTISRQGHEFASEFGKYWRDIPDTFGQNVQIKEIIVPQAGTKLTVHFANQTIYQTYMGRRQTPIKQRVETAVVLLIDALSRSGISQNNPDLADDEW